RGETRGAAPRRSAQPCPSSTPSQTPTHPGTAKRAAAAVTGGSKLRLGSLAVLARLSAPDRSAGRCRPLVPVAWLLHARRPLDTRRLPARRTGAARPCARNPGADALCPRPPRLFRAG